jgi:hypothetical protein
MDAGGLGGGLDHFAGRRIANERAGPSRWDLAQADLGKAGQDEFADTARMDGAEEEVLQRRVDAGGVFRGISFSSAMRLISADLVRVRLTGLIAEEAAFGAFLTAAFRATFAIRTFPSS